jgi:hypothetical protein
LLDRAGGRCSEDGNGINPTIDQFLRQPAQLVRIAISEFPIESNVLSFGLTKLA